MLLNLENEIIMYMHLNTGMFYVHVLHKGPGVCEQEEIYYKGLGVCEQQEIYYQGSQTLSYAGD